MQGRALAATAGTAPWRPSQNGVKWFDKAISPLLRRDFAQRTAGHPPNGDLHGQHRPQRRKEPSLYRAVGRRDR